MRKVIDTLGVIFGALSLALLAKRGFNLGFAAPFEEALDYYEKSVQQLFGWTEPYLNAIFAWSGWTLHLHRHWKHILVLMWLYFGVVTKVIWPKFKSRRERILLLILTAWGMVLALMASVAAGAVDPMSEKMNAVMMTFPIVGFALYQLGWCGFLASVGRQETWWNRYRAARRLYLGRGVVSVMAVAVVVASFSARVPLLDRVNYPGLVVLFGLIVLLAFYWLWTGVEGAVYFHKSADSSWWHAFGEMKWRQSWSVTSNARIGLSMLKCIGGAIAYVLLGAGLEG